MNPDTIIEWVTPAPEQTPAPSSPAQARLPIRPAIGKMALHPSVTLEPLASALAALFERHDLACGTVVAVSAVFRDEPFHIHGPRIDGVVTGDGTGMRRRKLIDLPPDLQASLAHLQTLCDADPSVLCVTGDALSEIREADVEILYGQCYLTPLGLIVLNVEGRDLYQRHHPLTCAHSREVIEATRSGAARRSFHASQQASTMAS